MSKFTGNKGRRHGGGSREGFELISRPKRSLPYLVIVALWHWRWEFVVTIAAYAVHTRLVQAGLTHLVAVLVMATFAVALVAFRPSRRFLRNRFWCVVTRHRLRVCLRELRTLNHSGNAALILAARGTKEGEVVWLWMRPGLSVESIENRLEAIAAACWARDARVTRSHRLAALLRVDVLRRDPLAQAHEESPLLGVAKNLPSTRLTGERNLHLVQGRGNDSNGVSPEDTATAGIASTPKKTPKKTTTSPVPELVVLRNGEDVSDYV